MIKEGIVMISKVQDQVAESMGFTRDTYESGTTYTKKRDTDTEYHVIQCKGGWKRAIWEGGKYTNWRMEKTLIDALID